MTASSGTIRPSIKLSGRQGEHQSAVLAASQALQSPGAHEQQPADVASRPSRNLQPTAPPGLVDVQAVDECGSSVAATGPSHAGTARDSRSPAFGATPALSALQIFRC
ncbi:hypothetical protein ACFYTG_32250 [Streptomyces mirabilis]|uniref:hypothetical protein n=1 Tax=Streptomyces mirabilis TaxID=68239 RepID=UPI0036A6D34F